MESSGISSISHNIGFQWTLKTKEIPRNKPVVKKLAGVRSQTYRFKGIDDLFFSLELKCFRNIRISVNGHSRWSFELLCAFAVLNKRAFSVEQNKKLRFLNPFTIDHLHFAEEVTIHCMISAKQRIGVDKEADLHDAAKEKIIIVDDAGILNFKCGFDGEIPDFTVDSAKELVRYGESDKVLVILALEYLMRNCSPQNVSSILEIAVTKEIKVLQEHCVDFLISKCTVNDK